MSAIGRGGFLWVAAGLTCLAVGMPLVLDGDCCGIYGGGYPLSHNPPLPDGCLLASWCMVADNLARFPSENVPRSL